jgi:hypothetical protein
MIFFCMVNDDRREDEIKGHELRITAIFWLNKTILLSGNALNWIHVEQYSKMQSRGFFNELPVFEWKLMNYEILFP